MKSQEMHQQNSKSCNLATFSFGLNKSALILSIFVIGAALAFLIQGENLGRQKNILSQKLNEYRRLLKQVNMEDGGSNLGWDAENQRFATTKYFFSSTPQQNLTPQTTPEFVATPKQTNLRSADLPSSITPPVLPLFIQTTPIPQTNGNQFAQTDAPISTTPDGQLTGQNAATNVPDFSQQALKPTLIGGISEQQRSNWTKYIDLKSQPLWSALAEEEKENYQKKYNTHLYDELPFCIFVPSYNNAQNQRYLHNLNSILQQDYSNYYIVFVDDGSTDGTGQLVQQYAQKHRISKDKLRIITNQERKMAMPNIHRAANELCQPDDLFMIVDGDDQLLGKQVLKLFNAVFQKQKSWVVYSNFLSLQGQIGYSRPYADSAKKSNSYRQQPFFISHLRVFYTKLFTYIRESDLKDDDGNWFRAANDVAMYLPMLEMSHERVTYLPELCYVYNSNTGLNNHQVKQQEQRKNDFYIRTKSNYPFLDQLFSQTDIQSQNKKRGRQIFIKDFSLPAVENVQVFGWEL